MAFTQKPGRQGFPKTGHGLPSPLMQNKLTGAENKKVGDWSDNSIDRVKLEASAKNDSIAVSRTNIMEGHTKKYAGKMGNQAANDTRTAGGAPDMKVYKASKTSGEDIKGPDRYFRPSTVEKNAPRISR